MEREYHGYGEEYNWGKRKKGSNIIFPIILRLLGRISSEEEGKGTKILGKKIKILTNGGGECRELYTPLKDREGAGIPADWISSG